MLPTGFPELDEHIGGLALGEEFVVIVARTNQGKSWILLKMATHICNIGHNVGYISPEMSYNAIGYRYDTLSAHFSNSDLFRGKEISNYKEHIDNLQKGCVVRKMKKGRKLISMLMLLTVMVSLVLGVMPGMSLAAYADNTIFNPASTYGIPALPPQR